MKFRIVRVKEKGKDEYFIVEVKNKFLSKWRLLDDPGFKDSQFNGILYRNENLQFNQIESAEAYILQYKNYIYFNNTEYYKVYNIY